MVDVPREWEGRVTAWVQRYRAIRQLLTELSELHVEKLRRRQG
jgi:hypothetical protein